MNEIVPTNTCPSNVAALTEQTNVIARFAKSMQLDLSDGKFTPALSWPYSLGQWTELEQMGSERTQLPLADTVEYEVHLMVENPLRIGKILARVGCARVIAHVEEFQNDAEIREAFTIWKSEGARIVGVALLLDTPISILSGIASECDVILVMAIARLGAQGAFYEPRVAARIRELHAAYPHVCIEVDGGVSLENIEELVAAGATRFAVGSAIFGSSHPADSYAQLTAAANAL